MAWVKIDDQFHDHPKVLEVGPLAEALYIRGLAYAARYLTDGFIPTAHLRRMGDIDALEEAEKLVESGLWEVVEKGYQVHDYLEYQPSAEKVKADREAARLRMEKARSGKHDANNTRRSDDVRPNNPRTSDNPVPSRPVPDHEVPDGTSSPTRKDTHEQRFDAFWSVYPKKVGKGAARSWWRKRKPSQALTETMVAAVREQSQSEQWTKDDGQYIPNPATWLNQERWDDVLPKPSTTPANVTRFQSSGRGSGRNGSYTPSELIRMGMENER